jgi:reactive intermediate/imine deaminase
MALVTGDIQVQARQVFANLSAVCEAAGSDLSGIVKLNIFLTDLSHFAAVNEVMAELFEQPYPARAAIGVKELPKGSEIEMDAIVVV